MAKEGSTVSGLMDSFATTVSVALQYGVPLNGPRQQVRPRPVRAERLHRQPGDPDRQVDRGLHLPMARVALPRRPTTRRRSASSIAPRSSTAPSARLRSANPFAAGIAALVLPQLRRHRPPAAPTPASEADSGAEGDSPSPPRRHGRPASRPDPPTRCAQGRAVAVTGRGTRRAAVIATNGHANGNGGGQGQRERRRRRADHPEPGRHEGELPDPGRRPQLRRLRLDHGPQRQLLQVPQLREHERLQLTRRDTEGQAVSAPVRYMGTKRRLASVVKQELVELAPRGRVADLFSGMGSVAEELATLRPVLANDNLAFATCIARARFTDARRAPWKALESGLEAAYRASLRSLRHRQIR